MQLPVRPAAHGADLTQATVMEEAAPERPITRQIILKRSVM